MPLRSFRLALLALSLGVISPGCTTATLDQNDSYNGGADGGADDEGGGGAPEDALKHAPSFEELYTKVFEPGLCGASTCHGEATQGGRLDLSTAEIAFDSLKDLKAQGPKCVSSGIWRVAANTPEDSLLYLKLFMDELPCGRLMPPTATIIPDEHKELVASWILGGARWNAVDY